MKSSFAFALAAVVMATGCASAEESGDADEGAAAQSTGDANLLDECKALEDEFITMSSTVAPSSNVIVEQRLASFGSSAETVNLISPDVHYDVRFRRAADGSVKFSLSIGPFAGINQSIEGADKRANVSGKVTLNADKKSGTLNIDSRRDVFERVTGQKVDKVTFTALKCGSEGPSFTVTGPVVSLEKSGTARAAKDALGRDVEVAPKVKYTPRAPSGALKFTPTFG